jgi:CRP-like cAMP-binding protein
MNDAVQALMATPLGTLLSATEAAELTQSATIRSVSRGAYLFRAGDSSGAMFIVLTGGLDVVLGQPATGETVVASLGVGQIAGELEAMTRSLRVASLVATEETTLLEVPSGQLQTMLDNNRPAATKLVHLIAKTLARRLAAVNQIVLAHAPKAAPATQPAKPTPPVEDVSDQEIINIDDDDLDVLDKIWS